jgi:hypothetical protein
MIPIGGVFEAPGSGGNENEFTMTGKTIAHYWLNSLINGIVEMWPHWFETLWP